MLGKVMKVGLKGMLATSAAAAAIFAGAQLARADGMPGGPGPGYGPGIWSGAYLGFESGAEWSDFNIDFLHSTTHPNPHQDGNLTVGFFGGYQHQFGPLVVGVELNLIGNQFDQPASTSCFTVFNCQARITDMITLGPRVGWAAGHFMPYVTGGWVTASEQYRAVLATAGTEVERYDTRKDGWYIGGGLDWKIARYAVIGVEYRHYDLGTTDEKVPFASASPGVLIPGDTNRLRAESDSVMVRGSLLFGRSYEPLK
jgi:outer membrane immunogenic protein